MNKPKFAFHAFVGAAILTTAIIGSVDTASAGESKRLTLPAWDLIYNKDGSINTEVLAGARAEYIEDLISNGKTIDMSRLHRTVRVNRAGKRIGKTNRRLVENGKVPAAHDIGNSYVVFAGEAEGGGKIYAATERLSRGIRGRTFVEFEFTRESNRVRQGVPWPVKGRYSLNDLRARVLFVHNEARWLEVRRVVRNPGGNLIWRRVLAAKFDASGCATDHHDRATACIRDIVGGGPIKTPRMNADEKGNAIQMPRANSLVEIALDTDALTNGKHACTSMLVRTPRDIALLGFGGDEER